VKISALIIDDSSECVTCLSSMLRAHQNVRLIGVAHSRDEAIAKVQEHKPELVVFEPSIKDGGILLLDLLKAESSQSEFLLHTKISKSDVEFMMDARGRGVLGVVGKSERRSGSQCTTALREIDKAIETVIGRGALRELVHKQAEEAAREEQKAKPREDVMARLRKLDSERRPKLIAIGASTGGPSALSTLISGLPKDFSLPVVICQHVLQNFSENLVETIRRGSVISVVEAIDGTALEAGKVYVAPSGVHLTLRVDAAHRTVVRLLDADPVNNCRPSVDVLFNSVADCYSGAVVSVILTGMGADGVAGMRRLKSLGATTIAESKESCVVFGMPMEAIRAGVVDMVLPVQDIAPILLRIARGEEVQL
jgi:two-component system chemotaxis response regulator CheB